MSKKTVDWQSLPQIMRYVLDLVNQNAAIMSLIFSLVVAGATVFYAMLTRALVAETRRMRQVQTEPVIAIALEPSEHGLNFLNFTIQNVGQGAARSIKLRAEPNFQRFKGRYIADLGLFKHGIKYLAPNQKITFFLASVLDDVHGKGDDLSRLNFTTHVSYESALGQKYDESFPIHFESLEGFGTIGSPPLISIAQAVDKIQKDIGHIGTGFRKLHVITETHAEVNERQERLMVARRGKGLAEGTEESPQLARQLKGPPDASETVSVAVPAHPTDEGQPG